MICYILFDFTNGDRSYYPCFADTETEVPRCTKAQSQRWCGVGSWLAQVCLASKGLASPTVSDCTSSVVPQTSHSWAALLFPGGKCTHCTSIPQSCTLKLCAFGVEYGWDRPYSEACSRASLLEQTPSFCPNIFFFFFFYPIVLLAYIFALMGRVCFCLFVCFSCFFF